jgi:hypothetical protein
MSYIPLPQKRINELNREERRIFRQWIGYESGGGIVSYPTHEEKRERQRRERWKKRYAGKGGEESQLLIRAEQIRRLRRNVKRSSAAKKWMEQIFADADEVVDLDRAFWRSFISDLGPWNCRGNFCPHCIGKKSAEGLNLYFWDWDWRDPERLGCPHCGFSFPDPRYPEEEVLELPRLKKRYTFYLRPEEIASKDWRLGEKAARYGGFPTHVSFSGNIRAMKLEWALGKVTPLSLAYAFTGKNKYARVVQNILERMAEVYSGYPLHSYLQDMVDAEPGFAVENADNLPTIFKRNACFSVYEGQEGTFLNGESTTETTRVASGLWGSSRLAPEMSATAQTFVKLFQAYDLVKKAISQKDRIRIEQEFLLELYLDVKAYTPITNKAGPVRASRIAFGLVYGNEAEVKAGLDGFHQILDSQFYPDGSMMETPLYGHKPIGEDLWQIPEMLLGHTDLYQEGPYRKALQGLIEIATPAGLFPPMDDTYSCSRVPTRTKDIARIRCGISVPGQQSDPSDFAMINADLPEKIKRVRATALNKFYSYRRLACLGIGSGSNRIQMYLSGSDGDSKHRHHDALNLQLFAGRWEVFPDIGYLWDHPGKIWGTATASHQTVVVDEKNSEAVGQSELLEFIDRGRVRFVDMKTRLEEGVVLRRAVTLLRKTDGLPILIDVFDVEGGKTHDYNVRAHVPSEIPAFLGGQKEGLYFFSAVGSQDFYAPPKKRIRPATFSLEPTLRPRKKKIYQEHSYYPLRQFFAGGRVNGGWKAMWKRGERRVIAHVLSNCDDLITYQSPAWRSTLAIAAEPNDYSDTLLLRKKGPKSRFIVVYEVVQSVPQIRNIELEEKAQKGEGCLSIDLRGGRHIQTDIQGGPDNKRESAFSVRWGKK